MNKRFLWVIEVQGLNNDGTTEAPDSWAPDAIHCYYFKRDAEKALVKEKRFIERSARAHSKMFNVPPTPSSEVRLVQYVPKPKRPVQYVPKPKRPVQYVPKPKRPVK